MWRLGTGPFRDGIGAVDGTVLAAAIGIGLLTTLCCAWRWTIVARGLDVRLSIPAAVAAYYRSVFLNLTLPGGVVGDVHRGFNHGMRPVVLERFAGQIVQAILTVVVLLALPSPVRSSMPVVALVLVAVAVVAAAVAWARGRLRADRTWLAVAVASALVVCGHAATFVIAARTAGATAPLTQMVPLALLVMLAMVLPSAGGWGPREGAAAWAFAAAGLGADQGVATAVVYGVLVFAASLPGAAVLVVSWCRRTAHA
jgi:uncharacterized membrane protein YbhN (UPF0104 family)